MEYIAVYTMLTGWVIKPNSWLNRNSGIIGYIGSEESCKQYISEQKTHIR